MSTHDYKLPAPLTRAQQAALALCPRRCIHRSAMHENTHLCLREVALLTDGFGTRAVQDTLWCSHHGRIAWERTEMIPA